MTNTNLIEHVRAGIADCESMIDQAFLNSKESVDLSLLRLMYITGYTRVMGGVFNKDILMSTIQTEISQIERQRKELQNQKEMILNQITSLDRQLKSLDIMKESAKKGQLQTDLRPPQPDS